MGLKTKKTVKSPSENGLFEEKKLFGGRGLKTKKSKTPSENVLLKKKKN